MDYYIREEAKTEGRDPRQELVDFVVSNKPYSDAYTFRITDNYRVSFARYRLSYTVTRTAEDATIHAQHFRRLAQFVENWRNRPHGNTPDANSWHQSITCLGGTSSSKK